MNDIFAAAIVMTIWAICIVALSRWNYWLSAVASIGAYLGAFVMMRALGFGAVAIAWAAMSAASAIIDVARDRTPPQERKASPLISAIAAFVVGLIGWPFTFAGTRYPASPAAVATDPAATERTAPATKARDDDDDDDDANRMGTIEQTLSQRRGIQRFDIGDFRFARKTDGEPAILLDAKGELQGVDESAATRIVLRLSERLETAAILGPNDAILATFPNRRSEAVDRDAGYALAAALGRTYVGAVVVEDALAGLAS